MKASYILSLALFLSVTVQSQTSSNLTFNKSISNTISQRIKVSPKVYKVANEKYSKTTQTSTKRISQSYKYAMDVLRIAERDSVYAHKAYVKKMALNDNIEAIKININDYLKSKGDFEEKKYLLEEAQFISDKYNLRYVIFSESYGQKSKKKEVKAHFNNMLEELEKRTYKGGFDTAIMNRLADARKKINATQKYEIIKAKDDVENYKMIALGDQVQNPENVVTGSYKAIGKYYVVNSYNGSQKYKLISERDSSAKNMNIKASVVLIQNSVTKVSYFVEPSFISNYANHGYVNQF